MKVLDIKLRTPGIFLTKDQPGESRPQLILSLELRKPGTEEWKDVTEMTDITVLSADWFPGPEGIKSGSIETGSLEVPLQSDPAIVYHLLVPDRQIWEYRILALNCLDCLRVFSSYGMESKILPDRRLVLTEGTIKS